MKFALTPDRSELLASGEDLSFILVEALDAQGNLAPLADNVIEFDVAGAGDLDAVNNGDQLQRSNRSFVLDCQVGFTCGKAAGPYLGFAHANVAGFGAARGVRPIAATWQVAVRP